MARAEGGGCGCVSGQRADQAGKEEAAGVREKIAVLADHKGLYVRSVVCDGLWSRLVALRERDRATSPP